jgi:hypothetical protein
MSDIVAIDDGQKRMLKVWELIADKEKKIPARIIFHVENPLDEPGWRWAPRSFISSGPESSRHQYQKGSLQPKNVRW